jgi:apolipoprotein N-acyltransferase
MNLPERPVVAKEQLRYARVLEWGARIGLAVAVLAFALYVAGVLPGRVPLQDLPTLWSLPLAEYLHRSATPLGWGWVKLAMHGDFASIIGIAILSSVSVACLAAVLPIYTRRSDRVYAILSVLAIGVLVLAASGVLVVRH